MVSTVSIAEQFDELGVEPSEAILERCLLIVLLKMTRLNKIKHFHIRCPNVQ